MSESKFAFIENRVEDAESTRPSLTYWQDAWRRLKQNKSSMLGIILIIFIIGFGVVGPYFTPYSYSDQINEYRNLPPVLKLFKADENLYLHVSKDYNIFRVSEKGELLERLEINRSKKDIINKVYVFNYGDEEVALDFSYNLLPTKQGYDYNYTVEYKGNGMTENDTWDSK